MITEDYTDFETSKLLKEKGFDEQCDKCWYTQTKRLENVIRGTNNNLSSLFICAPTLQMAAKWLRIKHKLHCDISYDFILGWCIQITSLKETVEDHYTEMKTYHPQIYNYPSYEEAYKEAIKYCLEELI